LPDVGRGTAAGDIDNDGDLDLIIGNNNGRARLLINAVKTGNHWIGLRLVGRDLNGRDMLGARVGIARSDGTTVWRRARADGSYASANDPRVLVGLGSAAGVSRVEVVWPSGRRESWVSVSIDRWTTLVEGTGQ
jgi:hypothetical protein